MADDEWEDTLVTSWTYSEKRVAFYASKIKPYDLSSVGAYQNPRFLVGILRAHRPISLLTLLCSYSGFSDVKSTDSILQLDHQNIKLVGDAIHLSHHTVRGITKGSKFVTGYLSSDGNKELLVSSGGILSFGSHQVAVSIYGFGTPRQSEWVDHFKWDSRGVVFLARHEAQVKELRGENIVDYPRILGALGFAATETQIFVVSGSNSGCQLTSLHRNNPNFSRSRGIVTLANYQFECMQVHKKYLLVCFRSKMGGKTLVGGYMDHYLYVYNTSDLSFMQMLNFSGCGFLPQKMHTKNTWKFLHQHNGSKDIQHVPNMPPGQKYPPTLTSSELGQLRYRNISRLGYDSDAYIREITVFPYEGDERNLVVALRDKAQAVYLFSIHKGKLTQFEGLRMFSIMKAPMAQQFRIFPRPDLKGIVAISDSCLVENISLTKYMVSH